MSDLSGYLILIEESGSHRGWAVKRRTLVVTRMYQGPVDTDREYRLIVLLIDLIRIIDCDSIRFRYILPEKFFIEPRDRDGAVASEKYLEIDRLTTNFKTIGEFLEGFFGVFLRNLWEEFGLLC